MMKQTKCAAGFQVIKTVLTLNHAIQRSISRINRYVESWKRHQSLWKTEKTTVLEKFKTKNPTNAQFEEKLAKYTKVDGRFEHNLAIKFLGCRLQLQCVLMKGF